MIHAFQKSPKMWLKRERLQLKVDQKSKEESISKILPAPNAPVISDPGFASIISKKPILWYNRYAIVGDTTMDSVDKGRDLEPQITKD